MLLLDSLSNVAGSGSSSSPCFDDDGDDDDDDDGDGDDDGGGGEDDDGCDDGEEEEQPATRATTTLTTAGTAKSLRIPDIVEGALPPAEADLVGAVFTCNLEGIGRVGRDTNAMGAKRA